jgi:hypothetical protein
VPAGTVINARVGTELSSKTNRFGCAHTGARSSNRRTTPATASSGPAGALNPQGAVLGFLHAVDRSDYEGAAKYLDSNA